MFSSSSNSTQSSNNPNRLPFTNPISSVLAPYMTSSFQPSSLNLHICSSCFRAFATVRDLVGHQNSHWTERNEFCARLVRMQKALRDGVTSPEPVSWVAPAEGSSSGNNRIKVLKVMPSAELTVATGAAPDILLELDESDDLELYLKL